jgi:hypothetical protein
MSDAKNKKEPQPQAEGLESNEPDTGDNEQQPEPPPPPPPPPVGGGTVEGPQNK